MFHRVDCGADPAAPSWVDPVNIGQDGHVAVDLDPRLDELGPLVVDLAFQRFQVTGVLLPADDRFHQARFDVGDLGRADLGPAHRIPVPPPLHGARLQGLQGSLDRSGRFADSHQGGCGAGGQGRHHGESFHGFACAAGVFEGGSGRRGVGAIADAAG